MIDPLATPGTKKAIPNHSSYPGAAGSPNFYGFDISAYPGDSPMQAFWTGTPFWFTGFYLGPAPRHPDTSWMEKRTVLKNMGWGFIIIYVGRQSADGQALSYAQGQRDALDAVNLAQQAGFPRGATIFLDVEGGGTLTPQFISYIKGWVEEMDSVASIYWPGVYCSFFQTANQINSAVGNNVITFWCVNVNCPPSPGCELPTPAPKPANCGVSYAQAWQFAESPKPVGVNGPGYSSGSPSQCAQTFGGVTLDVDLDVATSANPSDG